MDDVYSIWPPVKIYPDGHLDLEFGPLLLVDSVFIDSENYHKLVTSKSKRHAPLKRAVQSLRQLEDIGFLKPVCYYEALDSKRDIVISNTRTHVIRSFDDYRESICLAVEAWEAISHEYGGTFGQSKELAATLPLGIYQALIVDSMPITKENAQKIREVLFKKEKLTSLESELMGEVARPYLEHVHTNLALSHVLNSPVFDWNDLGPIYRAALSSYKLVYEDNTVERYIPKIRELFSISLANLEPANVTEFLTALKHPTIKEFRRFIIDAAENDVVFDTKLAENLLIEAGRLRNRRSKIASTVNILSALGSLLGGGLATSAMSPITDVLYRDKGWFLCLVSAKN